MKKNITVNIFGTLYAIDEDAYEMLEHYLDEMKRYFAGMNGGDEISDDIENRVAELLWERKSNGMEVVTVDVVKDIMSRIGSAADIDMKNEQSGAYNRGEHAATDGETVREEPYGQGFFDRLKERTKNRRLYRDIDDKLVGGVISGLCKYLGYNDPVIWRIAFIAVLLMMWSVSGLLGDLFANLAWMMIISYVVAIVVVPVARTTEDRLRMNGKKVSADTIREQVIADADERNHNDGVYAAQPQRTGGDGCLPLMLKVLLGMMLLPFGIAFFGLVIGFFTVLFVMISAFIGIAPLSMLTDDIPWFDGFMQSNGSMLMAGIVALITMLALTIYGIYCTISKTHQPVRNSTKWLLWLLWIICLAFSIFTLSVVGKNFWNGVENNTHLIINQTSPSFHVTLGVDSLDMDEMIETDTIGYDGV